MKQINNCSWMLALVAGLVLSAVTARATIDGFSFYSGNSVNYTVASGKILVLEQVCFAAGTTSANANLVVNGHAVGLPAATNGLYLLPKALMLPAGTTVNAGTAGGTLLGVIIDVADAPLFAGGGSSLGNVAASGNIITGEVRLSSTAPAKVIIQSSTNLLVWTYDSTVVVQRGTDKSKMQFSAPVSGSARYYRALVRRV